MLETNLDSDKRAEEELGLQAEPPMCFPATNTLGTVPWPVHSARARWISCPSPFKYSQFPQKIF